jgi:ArsR family transcriptional regulator
MPNHVEPSRPPNKGGHGREQRGYAADLLRESAARLFRALGHPARLLIIELLGGHQRSVSELAEQTELPADTVSKHLRALAAVRVVRRSQQGNFAHYSLRNPAFYRMVGFAYRIVTQEIERLQAVAELARRSAGRLVGRGEQRDAGEEIEYGSRRR